MKTKQNNLRVNGINSRNFGNVTGRASGHDLPRSGGNRALEQKLDTKPDVRADQVARGKALIADPDYPSKETMKKVAGLLAEKFTDEAGLADSTATNGPRIAITTVTA